MAFYFFFMMFGIKKVKTPLNTKTAPDKMNMLAQCPSNRNPAIFPPTRDAEFEKKEMKNIYETFMTA